jgi:hypothetical protein
MEIFPCTLVYIDNDAAASPNSTSRDPCSYARQALCLNKSLLQAGMPRLNIFTNAPALAASCFGSTAEDRRPVVHELVGSVNVPKSTEFYGAHFKLDLLEQVARMLGSGTLMLLLDADMVAIKSLDEGMVRLCADAGVGAFDISDQVFPAYGSANVIRDLEIVAGRHLLNPRWYGGEFLISTPTFLMTLVQRARAHCERYVHEIGRLQHHGDEAFVSSALNTLADEGQQIVELGAYQAIGRHWSGNTHRDLRWFQHCCFVHLPDGKALIERESHYPDFKLTRFWRAVSTAHFFNRARFSIKLCLEATSVVPRWRRIGRERGAELNKNDEAAEEIGR